MMQRRSFLGAAVAALAGSGVSESKLESAMTPIDLPPDGVGRLCKLIDIYGPETTAEVILRLSSQGTLNLDRLSSVLRTERRKEHRNKKKSERRERHAGDEVLYRGPLSLGLLDLNGQECVSKVSRHRVLVGSTDREYTIVNIGVPCPTGYREVRRDLDLLGYAPEYSDSYDIDEIRLPVRSVTIPESSRLLIDLRRGIRDIMVAEVVRTARGSHRLHLWTSNTHRDFDESTPRIAGGCVYTSPDNRSVGLLGLPLG